MGVPVIRYGSMDPTRCEQELVPLYKDDRGAESLWQNAPQDIKSHPITLEIVEQYLLKPGFQAKERLKRAQTRFNIHSSLTA
jgi:hypothetical protein